jgi:hypothetical protein
MFTNKDYGTYKYIMINNILGTEELKRKQNNVTRRAPPSCYNNKAKALSCNPLQNTLKVNFFRTKFESDKSSVSK